VRHQRGSELIFPSRRDFNGSDERKFRHTGSPSLYRLGQIG
jgi:hypothetical protein